jgi:hypothetical protein
MKVRSWKEKKGERLPVGEVRKARLWAAIPIGIAVGVAMSFAIDLVMGIAFGTITFLFLLLRRGRI